MTRDSGSGRNGEDSRSEAECEAPQSGPAKTGHRPTSGANLTTSGVERIRAAAFEDEGPIADAARRIASWTEGKQRINVYKAAKNELAALALPSEPPSQDVEADEDTGCPPHCCCCGPGEPCCDCGEIMQDCPHCDGEGDIDDGDHPCMMCGGSGLAEPPSQGDVEGRAREALALASAEGTVTILRSSADEPKRCICCAGPHCFAMHADLEGLSDYWGRPITGVQRFVEDVLWKKVDGEPIYDGHRFRVTIEVLASKEDGRS